MISSDDVVINKSNIYGVTSYMGIIKNGIVFYVSFTDQLLICQLFCLI